MIYLMVVLRTSEEIRECRVFTRHYQPMTFDSRKMPTEIWLNVCHDLPDFWNLEQQGLPFSSRLSLCHSGKSSLSRSLVPKPHRRFCDIVFLKTFLSLGNSDNALSQTEVYSQVNNSHKVYNTCSNSSSTNSIAEEKSSFKEDRGFSTHGACSEYVSGKSPDNFKETVKPHESLRIAIVPQKMCTMFLNAHLASAVLTCVITSPVFRWCLLRNLRKKFRRPAPCDHECLESDVDLTANYVLDIVSVWPVQRIDYAWGWCINHILTKRMLLEEAMAWLSTLGGAHSSLGEYYLHHAELAGQISLKQLKLALQLGDPLTVARCHMFWAFSLMQRGEWRKSKVIVRRVYRLASTHCVVDMRLINMCGSAWTRLQHLHRVQRRKKRGETVKERRMEQ